MATTKQAKGVMDVRATKGFTSGGESNEILRIAANGAYLAKLSNAFDPTREHLNFEVKDGKIIPVNKKKSIGKRERDMMKDRGIKDPNEGLDKPRYRTIADFIFGGSQEQMRKLAFGDQQVEYKKGADNSSVQRQKEIENWAVDLYNFLSKKYGQQNIAAFVVHLDETNPHVHCKILPITEKNKLSWRKVMVGEENTKEAYRKSMLKLHDELYEEVNKKYGLERGEHISETNAKHKTTEEYHAERRIQLQKDVENLGATAETLRSENENLRTENENLQKQNKHIEIKLKSLRTMVGNLESRIAELQEEIKQVETDRDNGRISVQQANMQLERIRQQITALNTKKEDKEKMLQETEKQLQELNKKIEDGQKRQEKGDKILNQMREEYKENIKDVRHNVANDIQSIAYSKCAVDLKNLYNSFLELFKSSTNDQRWFLNNKVYPILNDSELKEVANSSAEIVQIATNLFLGYLDKATDISVSGGGGGGPTSGWGKKDDEDDWAFKQRCLAMGIKMAKPAAKRGIKR